MNLPGSLLVKRTIVSEGESFPTEYFRDRS
jgi:hypothetical protein